MFATTGGEVEADQHDHRAGDRRRQHGVDDAGPEEVDRDTDQKQHQAAHQDGAGHGRGVTALCPNGCDTADERRAGAEVAGDLALDDQQEADRRDTAHHDRQLGVQSHEQREDEGCTEHRHDVLGTQTSGLGP